MKLKPKPKKKQRRALNKKPAFLAAFKTCASLTEAAAAVGIDRGQHYDWLHDDASYVAAFAAAREQAAQTLHDAAVERALKGTYEPNIYQGRFQYPQEQYELTPAVPAGDWKDEDGAHGGTPAVLAWRDVPGAPPLGVWKRSEMLHLALLKAHIPAFRTNATLEISGPAGGPIPLEQKRLEKLTDDELAALIAVAKKLTSDSGDGSGTDTPGAP